MTYEQELAEAHLKSIRLEHIIENQLKVIHEWRKKSDQDYAQMQRLYNVLEAARIFIEVHGGDTMLINEIEEAMDCVDFMPPKVFVV